LLLIFGCLNMFEMGWQLQSHNDTPTTYGAPQIHRPCRTHSISHPQTPEYPTIFIQAPSSSPNLTTTTPLLTDVDEGSFVFTGEFFHADLIMGGLPLCSPSHDFHLFSTKSSNQLIRGEGGADA
jgi:hypothetical protein